MQKHVVVGLLGLGTVGTGVVRILQKNGAEIARRLGTEIQIKTVLVRDVAKERGVELPQERLTTDPKSIIEDPEIDIVVEVMGGMEPARTYILQAIAAGKHVVTANKEVLAKAGEEIFAAADQHGVDVYFEASVAGGIPLIKPLKEGLTGNRIKTVMGIINGTTNYILTRMTEEDVSFEEVLAQAQELGYAEADPSSDVDGYDAAYKLTILASLAFDARVPLEKVHLEGIRKITPADIESARQLGYVIKLLAIGKESDAGVEVRVHPTFVPKEHPLASVHGAFNAVFVQGDAVGDLMFYGQGAGELPTGSAVVGDMIDAARNLQSRVNGRVKRIVQDKPIVSIGQTVSRYYLRCLVVDQPGVLAKIASCFGENGVSIESVIQKGQGEDPVSLVFVTHEVQDANMKNALDGIAKLPVVREICNVIRVEGESLP
ncbi:MAG: homoserine dehydrogenase [Limnochordia bacterium]